MSNLILIAVAILTIIAGILVLLSRTKVIKFKKNGFLAGLYFVLTIGLIYILLALFGGTVLEKITAYQDGVLSESEEECKKEDAPFWCHL